MLTLHYDALSVVDVRRLVVVVGTAYPYGVTTFGEVAHLQIPCVAVSQMNYLDFLVGMPIIYVRFRYAITTAVYNLEKKVL